MSEHCLNDEMIFTDEELLRYSRQILLPQIDVAGQQRIVKSKVLIVGAGGLGCPVGLYLAAAGVGTLTIVDADRIELSNLQRQIAHDTRAIGEYKADSLAARMRALQPTLQCLIKREWLNEDNAAHLIREQDVVVDCTDNFMTRFLINRECVKARVPLVSGAAIRGEGQLAVFANDGQSPCYACVYPAQDEEGETCAQAGVLAPVVGVIGALQAVQTLKVLAGAMEQAAGLLIYDAWRTEFRRLNLRRDPQCPVCSDRAVLPLD